MGGFWGGGAGFIFMGARIFLIYYQWISGSLRVSSLFSPTVRNPDPFGAPNEFGGFEIWWQKKSGRATIRFRIRGCIAATAVHSDLDAQRIFEGSCLEITSQG